MLKRLKFWEDRNNTGCGVMTTNRIAPEFNSSDSEVHTNKRRQRKKSKNFVRKIFSRKSPRDSHPSHEEIKILSTTMKQFVCYPYESDCRQETNRRLPDCSINIASSSSSTNTIDLTDDQKLLWVSADEAIEIKECPENCPLRGCGFELKNQGDQGGILKCHCVRCCRQLVVPGKTNQSRKSVKFEDIVGREKTSHLEVSDCQTLMTSRPQKTEAEHKIFWKNPLESYTIRRCSKNKNDKRNNNNRTLLSFMRSDVEKDLTASTSVSRCNGPTFIDEDLCLELQMSLNVSVNNPKKDLKCPSETLDEMNFVSLCKKHLSHLNANRNCKTLNKESLMKRFLADPTQGRHDSATLKDRLCFNCQQSFIQKSAEECPTLVDLSMPNCYKTLPNKNIGFPVFYENQTTIDDSCVKQTRFGNKIPQKPIGINDIKPLKSNDLSSNNGDKEFPFHVDNALYHATDCEIGKNFMEGGDNLKKSSMSGLNEKLEGSLKERTTVREHTGNASCKCLNFVAYDNKIYQATSKSSTNDSPRIQLETSVPDNFQKCILHTEEERRRRDTCNRRRTTDQYQLRSSPVIDAKILSCVKKSEEPVDSLAQSFEKIHQSIACAQTKNKEFKSNHEEQGDPSKCPWFWKNMTVEEAEDHLVGLPDGAFLVRNSSDVDHVASVSFRSCGLTHHTRIEHFQGNFSFHSTSLSHGKTTSIIQFLEKVIQSSSDPSCIHYLKPKSPNSLAAPVLLLFPLLNCSMT